MCLGYEYGAASVYCNLSVRTIANKALKMNMTSLVNLGHSKTHRIGPQNLGLAQPLSRSDGVEIIESLLEIVSDISPGN